MSAASDGDDVHRVLDAVWRMESPRFVASLTRILGDLGLAEDVAQDALEAAVRQWPDQGIPSNPAGWLMGTAKHHAIDALRRRSTLDRKMTEIAGADATDGATFDSLVDIEADEQDFGDDLLRLIFICCHPVLSVDARVALTLRLLGGLRTDEIARAFLVPEPTIGQRIVRAKRALGAASVPFEVPEGVELTARLESVLQVIYLVFNEGYSATSGAAWVRPALCEEALRLGRVLAALVPDQPEVHGLVALMEIQASRIRARLGTDGRAIPLLEQDRSRWDGLLIERGLSALAQAEAFGGPFGPYVLQASIAACHALARRGDDTDWVHIVALYDALAEVAPSPIVDLNRAVAVSLAYGPEPALGIVDAIAAGGALERYHLLPAVRGDLLFKLGRYHDAAAELARAASMTRNVPERDLLLDRSRAATDAASP